MSDPVPTQNAGVRRCVDCGREWESPMGSSFVCPGCGLVSTLLGAHPLKSEVDEPLRIVGVALLMPDAIAEVVAVSAPGRHHDVIRALADKGVSPGRIASAIQGFYDSRGHFLDRRAALAVAHAAGQIRVKTEPADMLFSEDLW